MLIVPSVMLIFSSAWTASSPEEILISPPLTEMLPSVCRESSAESIVIVPPEMLIPFSALKPFAEVELLSSDEVST